MQQIFLVDIFCSFAETGTLIAESSHVSCHRVFATRDLVWSIEREAISKMAQIFSSFLLYLSLSLSRSLSFSSFSHKKTFQFVWRFIRWTQSFFCQFGKFVCQTRIRISLEAFQGLSLKELFLPLLLFPWDRSAIFISQLIILLLPNFGFKCQWQSKLLKDSTAKLLALLIST